MFRNLFLLIALGLIIWIVQGFIRRSKSSPKTRITSKEMVQCEHCKTYLPKDDALSYNNTFFCSQQHLKDWNQGS